jgi:hypothetical protein
VAGAVDLQPRRLDHLCAGAVSRSRDGDLLPIGENGMQEHVVPKEATTQDPRVRHELSVLDDLFTGQLHDHHFDEDLAWAEPLDDDERQEMKQELATALVTAMLTRDWSEYDEALGAWRATAEVLRDHELTARLMADDDPTEEVPLRRP